MTAEIGGRSDLKPALLNPNMVNLSDSRQLEPHHEMEGM